ncbi:MAG: hypothetical protein KJO31_07530 [Gammaproteobacteria bacterium]|nr:hypothetical protein [Gammaproteobacteria bacterium]
MNDDIDNKDDEIMQAAAGLATEVAPGRDLWSGIEAAITAPARTGRSRWNSVWAQAAAVVLLVGGSSGVTYLAMKEPAFELQPNNGPNLKQLEFEPVAGSFGSQYNLGSDYLVAHRELDARLNQQLERLPAETREDVRKNIETIRAAIRDINKALADEPDNVLLQDLLLSTYREEMDLMIKVDGLASAVVRRNDI